MKKVFFYLILKKILFLFDKKKDKKIKEIENKIFSILGEKEKEIELLEYEKNQIFFFCFCNKIVGKKCEICFIGNSEKKDLICFICNKKICELENFSNDSSIFYSNNNFSIINKKIKKNSFDKSYIFCNNCAKILYLIFN